MKVSDPCYPLELIAELVRTRSYTLKPDAWRFFMNHDCDVEEDAHQVLSLLPVAGRFTKTLTLRDGRAADTYQVDYDGWDLYVKLYVVEDGGQRLVVMSCKP